MMTLSVQLLQKIINSDSKYKRATGWKIYCHPVHFFKQETLEIEFVLRDILLWKMYVIRNTPDSWVRCMRSFHVSLFSDARERSHHNVIFHNQWIGGGYSCAIEYCNFNDLMIDISKLIYLTFDDSRMSNIQCSISETPKADKYSLDFSDEMLKDPPTLL